ncbi:helix-turn-helix domain-containing protein [Mesorhizobium sp. ORM8.1]
MVLPNWVGVNNQTLPESADDHRKPLARYSATNGALASGFTTAELHHLWGHDRRSGDLPASIGFRDATVEMALQRVVNELMQPDPISVTMVESQAMQLLVQMVRLNGSLHEPAKGGLSSFDLKRAVAMIEASPDEMPTLADLAKEVGVSRFHFSRAFKQSTGMTPHAFMAQRRLERSADMLRSTSSSATEIALECGFGSSSHFSIAFKRAFGVNPTEFRRRCKI